MERASVLLARAGERDGVVVEHLEIVDAVERGIAEDRGFAVFVAASVDGHCAASVHEGLHLGDVGVEGRVGDGDGEHGFLDVGGDRLHADVVAEPLLQRGLHGELSGRGHLHAVGCEGKLQQAAAEVGQVDALAGRGEEHLLDELAHVVLVAG